MTHRRFSRTVLALSVATMIAGGTAGTAWAIAGVDFPSHNMQEAKAEVDASNFASAIDMLSEILRFEPENADAYNLLAYSQRNVGEFDAAMENYNKALQIDPKHANALEYQGELFLKLGKTEDAQKNLVLISEICPGGCDAKTQLEAAIERAKDGKFTWTGATGSN